MTREFLIPQENWVKIERVGVMHKPGGLTCMHLHDPTYCGVSIRPTIGMMKVPQHFQNPINTQMTT